MDALIGYVVLYHLVVHRHLAVSPWFRHLIEMERVLSAILLDRIGLYQYIFGFALLVAHKTGRALSNVANRRCFGIRSRIQSCNLVYS